jgi:sulfonate transport system substrate-binding protein
MTMKKVLPFLFLAFFLFGCSSTKDKNEKKIVRLATFFNAVDYAPYIVAKEKGWFKDALKGKGAEIEFSSFQSLPALNEALTTNNIDIVFEAEPPAIIGKAAGINLKIRDISCTLTQEIVVHNDNTIKSVKELKNKKIAVLAGTSSHYGVYEILKKSGLKPEEVEILDMMPPDAKIAFEKNEIDAWAVWPPFVEQEELSGKGFSFSGDEVFVNSVMVVNESFATNNPELLVEIQKVFAKAKQWVNDNPEEAIKIVAKDLGVDEKVVKKAFPKHNWLAKIDEKIIADIQAKADFLKTLGKIKNSVVVKSELILVK